MKILTHETQKKVYKHLGYKKKFRGRVLLRDIPELGLKKFNRLMPSTSLQDVANFEHTAVPFETSWWLASPDERLLHDCPLVMVPGIGLHAWSLDLMHGWRLGPVQTFVSLALNFCLDSGLWSPSTNIDANERRKLGLLALKVELFQWYREKRKDPAWTKKGTEVWNLTLTMIGSTDSPSLHTKAAESHGLLLFVRDLFLQYMEQFNATLSAGMARKGKLLCESAKAAVELEEVFATNTRAMPRQAAQRALLAYCRFLRFYHEAGGPLLPKHHWMFHLVQRALFKGNPRQYTTYRDESFNGEIAKIARSSHRRTWNNVIHWKCQGLHQKNHEAVLERFKR